MASLYDLPIDPADLAAAQAGERAAQERLYHQLAGPVFAQIRRLVPGPAAREDVFQDTLIAVFEHLPQYRGAAPFGAWVRRIAINRCFMHLRSPWQRARAWLAEPEEAADGADVATAAGWAAPAAGLGGDAAVTADLARLLGGLKPLARAIVWLHEVEGWSHEEIAGACGRRPSFSKSQLARAHVRLRELAQSTSLPASVDAATPLGSLRRSP